MNSFDVSTYFKSFVDDDKEALELLNEYIVRNNKRPVSVPCMCNVIIVKRCITLVELVRRRKKNEF